MSHSNRHWPSMFKSKPGTSHHQWHHDLSPLMANSCSRTPYASVGEERSPEPKPRWNPKPEQIRILEAIFNSGMVNPPRDEIRRIRCQLQEYGQVGDANVFYWFQNRKSRSKHKNRNLQAAKASQQARSTASVLPTMTQAAAPTSSSSSSSEKSSPGVGKMVALNWVSSLVDMTNSPTASVNQTLFTPTTGDFLQEPFVLQVQQGSTMANGQCFSDLSTLFQVPDQSGSLQYTGMLHELMSQEVGRKEAEEKMKMNYHSFVTTTTVSAHVSNETLVISDSSAATPAHVDLQGVGDMGHPAVPRLMVSINGVAFEIGQGLLNVREAFGGGVVLLYTSGQPVPTDEWGVTLQPLQHGSSYYLV